MNKLLSASLMCADLMNLESAIRQLELAGIDYLHIDIMDGTFVPNITLGFDLVNAIKKTTSLPLDIHMMVQNPARFIDTMHTDANDIISVHYEADEDISNTLQKIRNKGTKVALAINPLTSLVVIENYISMIDVALVMTVTPGFAGQKIFEGAKEKVMQTRTLLDNAGRSDIIIEVDGNISPANAEMLSKSGADMFVLGTSGLFCKDRTLADGTALYRSVL